MKYLIGYSGGKDSQVALDLALKKYENTEVFFVDSGLEFPETLETIKKTEKFYNIEIVRLYPAKSFEEYLKDFGGFWPSPRRRWCRERLKERPIKKYINSQKERIRVIDGIRKYESWKRAKRQKIEMHRSGKWRIEHIVFNWREEKIFRYIAEKNLPLNPLYSLGFPRASCWLCPFASQETNNLVAKTHPELHKYAEELKKRYGNCFTGRSKNL